MWEINPQRDLYPSYAPRLLIEDYYTVLNAYHPVFPNSDIDNHMLDIEMTSHKKKFHDSLVELSKQSRYIQSEDSILSQAKKGIDSVIKEYSSGGRALFFQQKLIQEETCTGEKRAKTEVEGRAKIF